jgi:hypothetical protein
MTTASLTRLPETAQPPVRQRGAGSLLARLRAAYAAYAGRRAMWRELSCCITDNAMADIQAAIERSGRDDAETREVRRFVARQRRATQRRLTGADL